MTPNTAGTTDLTDLLDEIYDRYGFDFRNYALASLKRRIEHIVQAERADTIAGLRVKLREPACMERFLVAVTVHVTAMFRDPLFFLSLRTRVVPLLKELPFVRIWTAGCSTGGEVYSLAILLHEEGLLSKCRIYATDISEVALAQAKACMVPLDSMQENSRNYQHAGGQRAFSEYYRAKYGFAMFDPGLIKHVTFAQHNLATDSSFNEFQLILCRNVMIYFNEVLSARVHRLLYESLSPQGFLGLGSMESARFTPHSYEEFEPRERIYRRKS